MRPYDSSINRAKLPDLEKQRSEQQLSIDEFMAAYNSNLPEAFPRASHKLLTEFKATYPNLFKNQADWTLGQHRKKVMDWLPQHTEQFRG